MGSWLSRRSSFVPPPTSEEFEKGSYLIRKAYDMAISASFQLNQWEKTNKSSQKSSKKSFKLSHQTQVHPSPSLPITCDSHHCIDFLSTQSKRRSYSRRARRALLVYQSVRHAIHAHTSSSPLFLSSRRLMVSFGSNDNVLWIITLLNLDQTKQDGSEIITKTASSFHSPSYASFLLIDSLSKLAGRFDLLADLLRLDAASSFMSFAQASFILNVRDIDPLILAWHGCKSSNEDESVALKSFLTYLTSSC